MRHAVTLLMIMITGTLVGQTKVKGRLYLFDDPEKLLNEQVVVVLNNSIEAVSRNIDKHGYFDLDTKYLPGDVIEVSIASKNYTVHDRESLFIPVPRNGSPFVHKIALDLKANFSKELIKLLPVHQPTRREYKIEEGVDPKILKRVQADNRKSPKNLVHEIDDLVDELISQGKKLELIEKYDSAKQIYLQALPYASNRFQFLIDFAMLCEWNCNDPITTIKLLKHVNTENAKFNVETTFKLNNTFGAAYSDLLSDSCLYFYNTELHYLDSYLKSSNMTFDGRVMTVLNNIGSYYSKINNDSLATEYYYDAFNYWEAAKRKNTGSGFNSVPILCNNLAYQLNTIGKYGEAERFADIALHNLSSNDRSVYWTSLLRKCEIFQNRHAFAKADELRSKVIDSLEVTLNKGHRPQNLLYLKYFYENLLQDQNVKTDRKNLAGNRILEIDSEIYDHENFKDLADWTDDLVDIANVSDNSQFKYSLLDQALRHATQAEGLINYKFENDSTRRKLEMAKLYLIWRRIYAVRGDVQRQQAMVAKIENLHSSLDHIDHYRLLYAKYVLTNGDLERIAIMKEMIRVYKLNNRFHHRISLLDNESILYGLYYNNEYLEEAQDVINIMLRETLHLTEDDPVHQIRLAASYYNDYILKKRIKNADSNNSLVKSAKLYQYVDSLSLLDPDEAVDMFERIGVRHSDPAIGISFLRRALYLNSKHFLSPYKFDQAYKTQTRLYTHIGENFKDTDNVDSALHYFRIAREMFHKTLRSLDCMYCYLTAENNYASLLERDSANFDEAKKVRIYLNAFVRKNIPADSIDKVFTVTADVVFINCAHLADICYKQNDIQGISEFEEIYRIFKGAKCWMSQPSDAASFLANYGYYLNCFKRYDASIGYLNEGIRIFSGEKYLYQNLIVSYIALGKLREAKSLFKKHYNTKFDDRSMWDLIEGDIKSFSLENSKTYLKMKEFKDSLYARNKIAA